MCGIVGFLTKEKKQLYAHHLELFEQMLICDSVRGNDSTGAFTVTNNNQVKIIKVATNPHYLFETKQWESFKGSAIKSGHILVGHNRKATFGSITRENAHPFAEKNIVLVHNGTVLDHKSKKNVEVDSHAICHQIAEEGYEKTIQEIKGSYALVWYDIDARKLNLIRNADRPLYYFEAKDFFAFASEAYMLGWLLKRNNFECGKLELLDENKLFEITWNPFNFELKEVKQKEPEFYPLVPKYRTDEDRVLNLGERDNLGKLVDLYPKESDILFCPDVLFKTETNRLRLEGVAYLPGKPLFTKAIAYLPEEMDEADAEDLGSQIKLLGKIRNIIKTSSDEVICYVSDIKTDEMVELWNDITIPKKEWKYFVDNIKCTKCKRSLILEEPELTSITKEHDGHRVVCSVCVISNFDKMPDELQERITNYKHVH